jgi:hypothetical protein
MQAYYEHIMGELSQGKMIQEVKDSFAADKEWAFLANLRDPSSGHGTAKSGNEFNRNTKSAIFIQNIVNAAKCQLCGGYLHRNSQSTDHKQDKHSGGSPNIENAQITHPYCNSVKDQLVMRRAHSAD